MKRYLSLLMFMTSFLLIGCSDNENSSNEPPVAGKYNALVAINFVPLSLIIPGNGGVIDMVTYLPIEDKYICTKSQVVSSPNDTYSSLGMASEYCSSRDTVMTASLKEAIDDFVSNNAKYIDFGDVEYIDYNEIKENTNLNVYQSKCKTYIGREEEGCLENVLNGVVGPEYAVFVEKDIDGAISPYICKYQSNFGIDIRNSSINEKIVSQKVYFICDESILDKYPLFTEPMNNVKNIIDGDLLGENTTVSVSFLTSKLSKKDKNILHYDFYNAKYFCGIENQANYHECADDELPNLQAKVDATLAASAITNLGDGNTYLTKIPNDFIFNFSFISKSLDVDDVPPTSALLNEEGFYMTKVGENYYCMHYNDKVSETSITQKFTCNNEVPDDVATTYVDENFIYRELRKKIDTSLDNS